MVIKVVLVAVACTTMVALGDKLPVYHPPEPSPPLQPSSPPPPSPPPSHPATVTFPSVVPKYAYEYAVIDPYNRNNYEVNEKRNGNNTEGGYVVDLPDGRKQIFNYVDNGDGLFADIKYEGEARHPPSYPSYPPPPPPPIYG